MESGILYGVRSCKSFFCVWGGVVWLFCLLWFVACVAFVRVHLLRDTSCFLFCSCFLINFSLSFKKILEKQ